MKKQLGPKISIIMSTYNGMPFLKQAVQSIREQSIKNFEFIIIDDCSQDGSSEYLKKIKDKRLILIRNKTNLGLSVSLNIGIKRAKGKYIARMDADDVSLPNRLKKQLDFMTKNPGVDLCGAWVYLVNQSNRKLKKIKTPVTNEQIVKELNSHSPIIHPSMFAKASFFKKNRYNKKFEYAEDYELLTRVKNKYQLANVDSFLLLFRSSDKRRSQKYMRKMDLVDLKVKIEEIKTNGLNLNLLFQIGKKSINTYLLPYSFKVKIAKALNRA